MYLIIKCNSLTGERIILDEIDDPETAYVMATWCDAECKVGHLDDEVGEPGTYVVIEDEYGMDKWQECCELSCHPAGLFNQEK